MSAPGPREFDVVIVGAGVVGCVMACSLLKRGGPSLRVALVADRFMPEPAAASDWDLRVFALSRASERLLESCGIWQSLPRARVNAFQRMQAWDASTAPRGPSSVRFDCAEIGEPNLGYIADGRILQWHALENARKRGVVTIEASLNALEIGGDFAGIVLGDGRRLRAGLLVGADGGGSKVRQLLDIGTSGHAYHQDALVAHVRTEMPHEDTAWQRFLPGGPLALLPLSDGRSSLVWTTSRAEASRLRALAPDGFESALTAASDRVLGRCTLSSSLTAFPLQLLNTMDYVQPRAVLLGDAAHVVHPLAGQGLNLGLLDCAALTQVLGECPNARTWGDLKVLRRYERRQRGKNWLAGAGLDGIERLFGDQSPVASAARRFGLHAVQRLPPIKRRLAQIALGLKDF